TPLHMAAQSGILDKLLDLLRGMLSNDKSAISSRLDVLKYLIGQGANVNATDKNGRIPLHLTAYSGHLDTVKYLIDEKRSDVVARNSHDTVLHLAVSSNNEELIRFVLEKIKEK